jgi:hypothetical protein
MWRQQVLDLEIPYPEKARLLRELEDHVKHRPDETLDSFSGEALADLRDIHASVWLKALERLGPRTRSAVETAFAAAPITALLIDLQRRNFMLEFIREGGAGMYPILALGAALMIRELLLLGRVVIVKDHKAENLRLDSTTVLLGALALVMLGVCATGLGLYTAASFVETKGLPASVFVQGLRESITCLIVSSSFAALIGG